MKKHAAVLDINKLGRLRRQIDFVHSTFDISLRAIIQHSLVSRLGYKISQNNPNIYLNKYPTVQLKSKLSAPFPGELIIKIAGPRINIILTSDLPF